MRCAPLVLQSNEYLKTGNKIFSHEGIFLTLQTLNLRKKWCKIMYPTSKLKTRPAAKEDKDFIISLIPRLTEFGLPTWRDETGMIAVDTQIMTDKLLNNHSDTAIFIAEDDKDIPLGFIHLQAGNDYYNKEKHGHISDVIVAPGLEGLGIGRLLMDKGEEWARTK